MSEYLFRFSVKPSISFKSLSQFSSKNTAKHFELLELLPPLKFEGAEGLGLWIYRLWGLDVALTRKEKASICLFWIKPPGIGV